MLKKLAHGLLVLLTIFPSILWAQFEDGRHYTEIPFSAPLDTGDKVEVREFFWYGCGHCFAFEPHLAKWLAAKPKHVLFVRTPAFLPRRTVHAKAYYGFEALGMIDKLHSALFDAIHIDQRHFDTDQAVAQFVASKGGDKEKYLKTVGSFTIDRKVKQAAKLAESYGVNSVPTIVVDGRYMMTSSSAGGHDKMVQLIDYLVDKVRKERKKK